MDIDELLKRITALKAENMFLKAKNSQLQNKVDDLKETIEELMNHNQVLGESIMVNQNIPDDKEQHPLETSILFEELATLPPPETEEETKKRSRLQKLAHEYKKVIYVAKKVNKVASGCATALKVGKYLLLLLL